MIDNHDPSNRQAPHRLLGGTLVLQEWLLFGVLLTAIGLFLVWDRYSTYREVDAEQRHLLAVQVRAVDENLSRQLIGISAAMRGLRNDLPSWSSDQVRVSASRRLKALGDAMPGVRTLLLLDRDGRVVASNRPELMDRQFSTREYFQQVRQQPDPQMLSLSPPFVSSLGVYVMNLTISVLAADGSFDGVVTATLDPDYFRSALRSTLYAKDVRGVVLHGDGAILMLEPPIEKVAGINLDEPGSFFRRHRHTGDVESVLTGISTATGDRRITALRTLHPQGLLIDKPIVVAVSRNHDAVFAAWRRQALIDGLLYALVVAATCITLMSMHRRQGAIDHLKQQRAEAERQSAERLELALEGADLGLWDVHVPSGATVVSERVDSMLGLPHHGGYPDSQAWSSRVHPDDWERVRDAKKAHLEGRTERFDETYRMRHADGHWIWMLDRSQVLERDAEGKALRMVGTHMDVTERMEVQLALERSEQSLATTLYSIGDAVIATDPQGLVVRMNATAERLTGWTLSEAIGQPLTTVFHIFNGSTGEPSIDPVKQVIESGEIVALANDTVLLSRDGSPHQISDSAAPIRTPHGEITGVVLVFSDVTQRYRIEQALRANEERLRSLLDNLASGVIMHGPDTQVLEANASACQMTGLTFDQMQGKSAFDASWTFLEEDGSTMARERFPVCQVAASGSAVNNLVLGVRRPDLPRPLWVLVNAYPVRGPDGNIEQIVVIFSDITERKEAVEELRLLAASVAQLNDIVIITEAGPLDESGPRIVFVNEAFHRITGWRSDEVIGRTPRLLQGPKTDPAELARIGAAIRRGEPVHAELINYTRQGAEYWVEFDIVPLLDRSGHVTHFVAVEREISERKRSEFERETLERRLREAQKMESIGTLAGGIAHDFNNILAAILGNVALARQDVAPGHPVLSSLEQINRAGLRARHLVQQILTFSRRDQHDFSLQSLGPVVEETIDMLRATLPAGVRLDVALPDRLITVRGDSTQLQQVLLNLCTNAWQALPEHGGRIEVGFERTTLDEAQRQRVPELPPGDCAHVWVRDNGSGMDEATRLRIFDPFFTTKGVGRGTGLGLSVVHGIVRAHRGAITLETAPGQGSTFHVYLPLLEAGAAEPAAAPISAVSRCGAGERVLYIDDDEVMVVMVERLLERSGFHVTVETDAAAAVARIRAQPQAFDVIVTDFNMPELSGIDVASQVARIRPELPVVISSGLLTDALRTQAAQVGVRALLQKEKTFEELADLLQLLLTPVEA